MPNSVGAVALHLVRFIACAWIETEERDALDAEHELANPILTEYCEIRRLVFPLFGEFDSRHGWLVRLSHTHLSYPADTKLGDLVMEAAEILTLDGD